RYSASKLSNILANVVIGRGADACGMGTPGKGSCSLQLRLGLSVQLQRSTHDRKMRRRLDLAYRTWLLWRCRFRWIEPLSLCELARRYSPWKRRGSHFYR